LPPGTLVTLWNADQRYKQAYLTEFPGYYKSGDAGYIDADGYVFVMTRVDDVINVAGASPVDGPDREVLASHDDVAECAVIGVADELKGQVPFGFLVIKKRRRAAEGEIVEDVVRLVRERIARSRPSRAPSWCSACPRPAQARSCAHHAEDRPTARAGRCRPPSTIR